MAFALRDFGVSSCANGNVNTTNVSAAMTAMTMLETPTLRVMSSASENPMSAAADLNA